LVDVQIIVLTETAKKETLAEHDAQFKPPARRCKLSRPDRPTSPFCVGVRPAVAPAVPSATRHTATLNALVGRSGRLNSHCHTRHDKTVLSVSCLVCQCELDDCSERVQNVFKFSVGVSLELSGIQFTPPKRTRHRQEQFCRVWRDDANIFPARRYASANTSWPRVRDRVCVRDVCHKSEFHRNG